MIAADPVGSGGVDGMASRRLESQAIVPLNRNKHEQVALTSDKRKDGAWKRIEVSTEFGCLSG